MSDPQPKDVPRAELVPARLELHHALQLVAIGVGRSLLPHRDDDCHTALDWHDVGSQWLGQPIPGQDGLRAGLRPADLTLTLGTAEAPARHGLPLAGKTLDDALAWLRARLREAGVDAAGASLDAHYEIPSHPVASGAAFGASSAKARSALADWFALASRLLQPIARERDAGALLTWPHHFDIATLLPAGRGGDGEERTVGVGLSPGDEEIAQPYWYVGPSPQPDQPRLVRLPLGSWQSEAFFGAGLTAEEIFARSGDPAAVSRRFLAAAIDAAFGVWG